MAIIGARKRCAAIRIEVLIQHHGGSRLTQFDRSSCNGASKQVTADPHQGLQLNWS